MRCVVFLVLSDATARKQELCSNSYPRAKPKVATFCSPGIIPCAVMFIPRCFVWVVDWTSPSANGSDLKCSLRVLFSNTWLLAASIDHCISFSFAHFEQIRRATSNSHKDSVCMITPSARSPTGSRCTLARAWHIRASSVSMCMLKSTGLAGPPCSTPRFTFAVTRVTSPHVWTSSSWMKSDTMPVNQSGSTFSQRFINNSRETRSYADWYSAARREHICHILCSVVINAFSSKQTYCRNCLNLVASWRLCLLFLGCLPLMLWLLLSKRGLL